MGPRSFERGNATGDACRGSRITGFNGAAFFRTRKYVIPRAWPTPVVSLQWGRVLSNAEMAAGKLAVRESPMLQWGRVLSNAEMGVDGGCRRESPGFNGAAFFRTR